ncbi:MAG: phosphoglucosamine mutase [Thermoplasmata archaeon]|nr:phosphoglucosamine mutase [Thermoplasmata archaeon]
MDEQEIADQRKLFGTNGIRGIIGPEMNAELALGIGSAVGTILPGEIIVGTDSRTSNQMLKNALISGLLATGCDAIDIDLAPTPSVQYSVAKSDASAGVVITASHNPPEFNGIKVIDSDGTELDFSKELEIEKRYFSREFKTIDWKSVGKLKKDKHANERYSKAIASLVNRKTISDASLRIIVDCSNGVGGLVTPGLLSSFDVDVMTLNAQPHGSFPGHPSEPTPENLSELMKMVIAEGASFGNAQDGDADRSIFIDDKGSYITGDKSFALLAGYLSSKNPGAIVVSTVATSDVVSDMVIKNGGKIVQTRVGSPIVARKMKEIGAIFGGEENGGLIYAKHQYCRDAAMTTALMAQLAAERGALSEQLKELPVYHQSKLKTACPNEKKKRVLASLAESMKDKRVDLTDGVKIFEGERDWVIIRPSGTEQIFRIFSQSRSEDVAKSLADRYMSVLQEIIAETS